MTSFLSSDEDKTQEPTLTHPGIHALQDSAPETDLQPLDPADFCDDMWTPATPPGPPALKTEEELPPTMVGNLAPLPDLPSPGEILTVEEKPPPPLVGNLAPLPDLPASEEIFALEEKLPSPTDGNLAPLADLSALEETKASPTLTYMERACNWFKVFFLLWWYGQYDQPDVTPAPPPPPAPLTATTAMAAAAPAPQQDITLERPCTPAPATPARHQQLREALLPLVVPATRALSSLSPSATEADLPASRPSIASRLDHGISTAIPYGRPLTKNYSLMACIFSLMACVGQHRSRPPAAPATTTAPGPQPPPADSADLQRQPFSRPPSLQLLQENKQQPTTATPGKPPTAQTARNSRQPASTQLFNPMKALSSARPPLTAPRNRPPAAPTTYWQQLSPRPDTADTFGQQPFPTWPSGPPISEHQGPPWQFYPPPPSARSLSCCFPPAVSLQC